VGGRNQAEHVGRKFPHRSAFFRFGSGGGAFCKDLGLVQQLSESGGLIFVWR
jgi:hypothetical protein